jgi:hypothetical protein
VLPTAISDETFLPAATTEILSRSNIKCKRFLKGIKQVSEALPLFTKQPRS